jgi:hypothetical protein
MNKILNLFADPAWVFSSLVLALLINLVSAIAKDRADVVSRRLSESAKEKAKQREATVERMAAALKGHLEERIHLQFLQLKAMIRGSMFAAAGLLNLSLAAITFINASWVLGALMLAVAGSLLWTAFKDFRLFDFIEEILPRSLRGGNFWKEAKGEDDGSGDSSPSGDTLPSMDGR